MKKFLFFMLALMFLVSMNPVTSYASDDDSSVKMNNDEGDDSDERTISGSGKVIKSGGGVHFPSANLKETSGSDTGMGAGKATFKEFTVTKKTDKEMLKIEREKMKEEIEANKEEAKMNREMFRSENSDDIDDVKSNLSDTQKEALKKLYETHKMQMEALRTELKNSTTQEAREAIYSKMKALGETHYTEVATLLGEDASSLIEKRKDVWQENETLRNESRMIQSEYKEVKRASVEKYRKAFAKKLGNSLEKIPAEKLPQIVERIYTMMSKSGNSDSMLAALTAILELVEEKIDGDEIEADVLDVVESLIAE